MKDKPSYTPKEVSQMFSAMKHLIDRYNGCERKGSRIKTPQQAHMFFFEMEEYINRYRKEVPENVREEFQKGAEIEDLFDKCDSKRRLPKSNSPYNFGPIGS